MQDVSRCHALHFAVLSGGIDVVGVFGGDIDNIVATDWHRVEIPGTVLPVSNPDIIKFQRGKNRWSWPHGV